METQSKILGAQLTHTTPSNADVDVDAQWQQYSDG
jgi:hypothetical protein